MRTVTKYLIAITIVLFLAAIVLILSLNSGDLETTVRNRPDTGASTEMNESKATEKERALQKRQAAILESRLTEADEKMGTEGIDPKEMKKGRKRVERLSPYLAPAELAVLTFDELEKTVGDTGHSIEELGLPVHASKVATYISALERELTETESISAERLNELRIEHYGPTGAKALRNYEYGNINTDLSEAQ